MMKSFALRIARGGRLTTAEIAGTVLCALTFTLWNAAPGRGVAREAPIVFAALVLSSLLAGRLAARVLDAEAARDVPTALVFGYLLLNSALYLLAWVSPLPIAGNALVLLAGVVAAQVVWPPPARGERPGSSAPGLLALAIGLAAATFWSQDSITPMVPLRDGVLVKPWADSFFHACEIRMFRDARGAATLEDLRMAGEPAWAYHHASYLAAALVSATTGTPAYRAFTGFYVPFGVVLSGLAAYTLVRSVWGEGAGLAAMVALLLVPGAPYHGLANDWMGYRWLQQIAPGGYYGVACLAVAWMLMVRGCRSGRPALVALAFLTTATAVHYKAHLFVAGALPIWLYPGVFLRGVARRWKAAWLVFALATFVGVAGLSQRFESVPTLRLDWSSVKPYMLRVGQWSRDDSTREHYTTVFTPESSLAHDIGWGAVLLGYATLGLFGAANLALALLVLARRPAEGPGRVEPEHALFPLLIAANYLVMALGLSYDLRTTTYGLPDELRHRPLVWAYFVSASWAGGLAYQIFLRGRARHSPRLRRGLIVAALALLGVPVVLGREVQVGPSWGRMFSWKVHSHGWHRCVRYLRENAGRGDIVQDSEADARLAVSALAERPAYAINYTDVRPGPVLSRRLEEMRAFRDLDDEATIRRFAAERGIRWYLLHPRTRVRWPASLLARPAFASGGFRVYSFDGARRRPGGRAPWVHRGGPPPGPPARS